MRGVAVEEQKVVPRLASVREIKHAPRETATLHQWLSFFVRLRKVMQLPTAVRQDSRQS